MTVITVAGDGGLCLGGWQWGSVKQLAGRCCLAIYENTQKIQTLSREKNGSA